MTSAYPNASAEMISEHVSDLKAVRSNLSTISERLQRIPFENPIQYSEHEMLKAQREALFQRQFMLLSALGNPRCLYGIDIWIAEYYS